ncbi:MAG: hypothetical protein A3H35_12030 [Betaproteobacteria bacterium RIFCSPLOWO2_02_FULL_62_17]|nr:MAG: hypothetical protein A3H35_12030 [Betaproteobacteria bacterium RIFCSPLOWO2_02_FULL_62_17]
MSELAELVPEFFWLAAFMVFIGYIVFGLIGSGAGYLVIPVVSHVWAMTFLMPVASALDLSAALAINRSSKRDLVRAELHRMIPMAFLGALAGVTLLVSLPRNALLVILGSAAIFFGMLTFADPVPRVSARPGWAYVAGFIGGACGALFGIGAPPYQIYLARRLTDKAQLRATVATVVFFSVGSRLFLFALAGLFLTKEFFTFVLLLPFGALGLWVGSRAHLAITRAQLGRAIGVVLLLAGGSLLWRVFQ